LLKISANKISFANVCIFQNVDDAFILAQIDQLLQNAFSGNPKNSEEVSLQLQRQLNRLLYVKQGYVVSSGCNIVAATFPRPKGRGLLLILS
jgi:hypothetical protein